MTTDLVQYSRTYFTTRAHCHTPLLASRSIPLPNHSQGCHEDLCIRSHRSSYGPVRRDCKLQCRRPPTQSECSNIPPIETIYRNPRFRSTYPPVVWTAYPIEQHCISACTVEPVNMSRQHGDFAPFFNYSGYGPGYDTTITPDVKIFGEPSDYDELSPLGYTTKPPNTVPYYQQSGQVQPPLIGHAGATSTYPLYSVAPASRFVRMPTQPRGIAPKPEADSSMRHSLPSEPSRSSTQSSSDSKSSNYVCDKCGKVFAEAGGRQNLWRHKKEGTAECGEKPKKYGCSCGKSYKRKEGLNAHQKKAHPN